MRFKIVLLAALCLTLVGLTACGNSNDGGNTTNTGSGGQTTGNSGNDGSGNAGGNDGGTASEPPADVDPLGKYDPPIEVTAVRSLPTSLKFENGDTIDNNGWTKLYAQELGINLKYQWVTDGSQYAQKLNVIMASGQIPDILPVNSVQMKQLYDAGLLEDLSQVFDQYASDTTKEMLNKDGGMALSSATFKGQLVGLPNNTGSTDTAPLLWIRADWLKKLGLSEPKTMDDVYKIAEAFVKNDPDGDGKADTSGLGVAKDLFGNTAGLEGFFNGYHAYPNIWVKDASGQLVYGDIQPEMKTALTKLQEMYKNGIIDKEFGVKNADQLIQDVNSGKLGIFFGQHFMPLVFQDGKNSNPDFDLRPYNLPSVDADPAKPETAFSVSQYFVVRKGAEHPEAVVKLMNAYLNTWPADKYPPTEISSSTDGKVAKWQYALVQGANPTQNIDISDAIQKFVDTKDQSALDNTTSANDIYKYVDKYQQGDNTAWGYTMVFGPGGSQSVLSAYNKNNGFMPTAFISGPTESMGSKKATLDKLELEAFTKIIMGAAPVDSFDDFTASWKKLGGDDMTKEVADWAASR